MSKHIHEKVIKAWADGKKVQQRLYAYSLWEESPNPSWSKNLMYRVKPDATEYCLFYKVKDGLIGVHTEARNPNCNLKLTFDIDTNELKSAEVLK